MRKKAITSLNKLDSESLRIQTMLENMHQNKAFTFNQNREASSNRILLKSLKKNYSEYRKNWKGQPKNIINNKLNNLDIVEQEIPPLCLDIEVAAVCDLACPHCYRQFIVTPDKIISDDLCKRLIDQAADLKVPSIKFNWRGEPLLHPKLYEFIKYAKKKGILETIINTNATKLNAELSKKLIESGLDICIFSFDGGTEKTYEKLRPGRFKENKFKNVYENIKNFCKIRNDLKSNLPLTKVQMVLTEQTHNEQDDFFQLFNGIVDDVSVKQYTERGGDLEYLKKDLLEKKIIDESVKDNEIMRESDGSLYVSTSRLPCEQPYQRLLVTYDGKVSMCCYDWGSMHPVGYADELAIKKGNQDNLKVKKDIENKKKGFELMKPDLAPIFNEPDTITRSLREIWTGEEITKIRDDHMNDNLENVKICIKCPFKETYNWKKLD